MGSNDSGSDFGKRLSKSWHQARYHFFHARVRHLVNDRKWPEALTAVIDLAQWLEGKTDDPKTWLDLVFIATEIVGHLDEPAEYRAFLARFAAPFLAEPAPPPALLEAFASISDHVEPEVMVAVGRWLSDARPRWPLGPYLMAHFTADDADPLQAAQAFQRAEDRAQRAKLPQWQLHARLRRGALLLTTGADRQSGRDLLGSLDWSALSASEQLWMAVALSYSARWTDRLRAMDIILDLHQAITTARPAHRALRLDDLKRAAGAVFQLAGLHLSDAEEHRLEELSHTLFAGPEQQHWHNYLQARRELSRVATLPFHQSGDVLTLLDKLSALHPERWRPVTQRFRILRAGYSGSYAPRQSLLSPGRDARLPVADAVAALLQGISTNRDPAPTLQQLNAALRRLIADQDGAAARPVALVWAALLEDSTTLDRPVLSPLLTELARHHTTLAPPPSYGWWKLAAHLFNTDLPDPATIIAERALSSTASDDPAADFVTHQVLRRAVNARDAPTLLRWLG